MGTIVLTAVSYKFGLGRSLRLVQSKIVSQPEITSQIEIITAHLSDPCMLRNKQVVTSPEVSSRQQHSHFPGVLASRSICLTEEVWELGRFPHSSREVGGSLGFFSSWCCSLKVKKKEKGDEYFVPGWGGDQSALAS